MLTEKSGNHVEAVFKRVQRWTLQMPDILEEQFVKITPASELPFGDLSIWMSVKSEDIKELAKNLPHATKACIKRFDGCGELQEKWDVTLHKVYNVIETTDPDDLYGNLEFKIKWAGIRKQ